MPYRNYTSAQSSQKHAKVARCTSKQRSFVLRRRTSLPVSAGLGAGRPMDTWNIDSKASGIKGQNDTNLRERTKSQRCIRFPNQGGDIRIGGEESKAWEARIQKKPAREESGTFERRKFELRRHRPALVIFVRVRVVGTWQERFDTLFEHSMPQHNNSAPAHTWQIA